MKMINQHNAVSRDAPSLSCAHEEPSCRCQKGEAYIVSQPFSEEVILYLQELFLTNDWHCITVDNIQTGRSIITTLLYSLNYYHDVACLSLEEMLLDSRFFDVYTHMLEGNYLEGQGYDIEDFLLDSFYADFLWIEETDKLQAAVWYPHFLQALKDLNIDKQIPVLFISYK
jgi:hypothetical protein